MITRATVMIAMPLKAKKIQKLFSTLVLVNMKSLRTSYLSTFSACTPVSSWTKSVNFATIIRTLGHEAKRPIKSKRQKFLKLSENLIGSAKEDPSLNLSSEFHITRQPNI